MNISECKPCTIKGNLPAALPLVPATAASGRQETHQVMDLSSSSGQQRDLVGCSLANRRALPTRPSS
jgi:hypothetical protein